MITTRAFRFILIGFVLVLIGFVVPLLMVIRLINPGFLLGFASYGASVVGLLLGLYGALDIYLRKKADNDRQ
ncbi:MAG TPA: hypothetical protein G4O08_05870 [Anaerolineae bacterium]|nr:hypothetical protein [Anaerolineae bacterium]